MTNEYLEKLESVHLPSAMIEGLIIPTLSANGILPGQIKEGAHLEPLVLYYQESPGVYKMSSMKFALIPDGYGTLAVLIRRDGLDYKTAREQLEDKVETEGHEKLYSNLLLRVEGEKEDRSYYIFTGVGMRR